MYQVQIWNVGEWYGWGFTDYDMSSKRDAQRAASIASKKYGWKTRIVKIK